MKLYEQGGYWIDGHEFVPAEEAEGLRSRFPQLPTPDEAAKGTIAASILQAHNTSKDPGKLAITFDAMASHDITFVGIVQTARASGLTHFPMPYVLTCCHNSLCAVGGTINEDDHLFGLSAAEKYGGVFVPAHLAVIHQYMREMQAGCGKMILGSDSHTRYGAIGPMAIGEGGPELVKQLLGLKYEVAAPKVVGVNLHGKLRPGVGPQDVALALVAAVFENKFVKNCVLEFVGEGVADLSMDERCGIDVMTTETTCLSSIWQTDEKVHSYLALHGRGNEYACLQPEPIAYYDKMIDLDLSEIECQIALPFHPSTAVPIRLLNENLTDLLAECEKRSEEQVGRKLSLLDKVENGKLRVDQGVIAGCSGGSFENLSAAADILRGKEVGSGSFTLDVYPASQPIYLDLIRKGVITELMSAGGVVKTAFCGPCFGAGDVPANNCLSIRHSTRNFPNREGSKPGEGQISGVALMDARSIAATAANGGILTAASDLDVTYEKREYQFDDAPYRAKVYSGVGQPQPEKELRFGPNIADWPAMPEMSEHYLLKVAARITDPVTTTDELIPSGETSSYRSNPERLSSFALSRKCPDYAKKAKAVRGDNARHLSGDTPAEEMELLKKAKALGLPVDGEETLIGTAVAAVCPGDGSAREQAASCQKVLGTLCNISVDYATKRYRSNLINWGMIPFVVDELPESPVDSWLYIPNIKTAIASGADAVVAYDLTGGKEYRFSIASLTPEERQLLLDGCLINQQRKRR